MPRQGQGVLHPPRPRLEHMQRTNLLLRARILRGTAAVLSSTRSGTSCVDLRDVPLITHSSSPTTWPITYAASCACSRSSTTATSSLPPCATNASTTNCPTSRRAPSPVSLLATLLAQAADIVRHVGVGRNEYIAILNQCKSKKLLWRVNKGIARDFLPATPLSPRAEPWWLVNVVNVGETEYRALDAEDKALLKAAAVTGGVPLRALDAARVMALYTVGLVYFTVPILHSDHVAIPPLEVVSVV